MALHITSLSLTCTCPHTYTHTPFHFLGTRPATCLLTPFLTLFFHTDTHTRCPTPKLAQFNVLTTFFSQRHSINLPCCSTAAIPKSSVFAPSPDAHPLPWLLRLSIYQSNVFYIALFTSAVWQSVNCLCTLAVTSVADIYFQNWMGKVAKCYQNSPRQPDK